MSLGVAALQGPTVSKLTLSIDFIELDAFGVSMVLLVNTTLDSLIVNSNNYTQNFVIWMEMVDNGPHCVLDKWPCRRESCW